MTVNVSKPAINVREKLAELDKPTGIAGEAMLRAETPQEQFNLIGAGRRNFIINGAMEVHQRGGTISTDASDVYTLDRFTARGGDVSQSTDVPSNKGFKNSLFYDNDGTRYGINIRQKIENGQYLFIGREVTLSFWIKATKAGTINIDFTDGDAIDVNIASANTWEYHTVTFPPDDDLNSSDLFDNAAWVDFNLGTHYPDVYLTGVQLELGKVATPFEHRSYGEELALCQRYYYKVNADGQSNNPALGIGYFGSTTTANLVVPFPVKMRTNPTSLEQSGTASHYKIFYSGTVTTCSAVPTFEQASREAGRVTFTISSGGTLGLGAHGISAATGGYLAWSAEL